MTDARILRPTLVRRAALVLAVLTAATLILVARADAAVYWASATGHQIGRANLDGTGVNTNFITGLGQPAGVAVDGAHVYWSDNTTNTIGRANLDGSGVNTNFITNAPAEGIVVDGSHIYWGTGPTIGRANLDGSGVDPSFITNAGPGVNGIAVDGAHIYWANFPSPPDGPTIARANLDGSGVDLSFITDVSAPDGVAVNATNVYWTDLLTGSIGRADLGGGNVQGRFIDNLRPTGLALDAAHLYWGSSVTTIGRADLDGTNLMPSFITGPSSPEGVAVDGLTGPPPPTIGHLIDEVKEQGLPHGIENSLLAKLENAQRKVDAGHSQGACGSLGAYINEVKAQAGKKLEPAYAQALVADATAVRDSLGCGA